MNGCIQLKINFTILLLPEKGYISVSFTMKKDYYFTILVIASFKIRFLYNYFY